MFYRQRPRGLRLGIELEVETLLSSRRGSLLDRAPSGGGSQQRRDDGGLEAASPTRSRARLESDLGLSLPRYSSRITRAIRPKPRPGPFAVDVEEWAGCSLRRRPLAVSSRRERLIPERGQARASTRSGGSGSAPLVRRDALQKVTAARRRPRASSAAGSFQPREPARDRTRLIWKCAFFFYSGNPRTSENCLTESSGSIPVIG